MQKTSTKYLYLFLFTLPALVFYVAFAVYPLFSTLLISFFKSQDFVGIANYVHLFTNPEASERFWNALVNNIEFFLIAAIVQLPVGLLMAALLTSGAVRRMTGFYRTILFIPTTLSVVIVGFIWRLIISPLWGIVGFPLLGDKLTALPTLTLMSVWEYVGIPMIFLYSALLAIPHDLVEAARIDGASGTRVFWRIKLPLIAPQFGLITILTFIWTFNAFDIIFALNGGAPGPDYSTDILGTLFYRTFFGWQALQGDANLGATTATVIFFIILVVTAGYFFVLQRRLKVHEL
jgi:raffinose/stachyose/melibiose transport system permease protein